MIKRLNIKTTFFVYLLIIFHIEGCAKVQQPKSEDAKIYNDRGIAHVKKGLYERAFSNFNKALEINPGYGEAYYNRGRAYQLNLQYDKAISDFNRTIKITPRHSDAYKYRGNVSAVQDNLNLRARVK